MFKKSLRFAFGTLLSRLFGLLRESVIAGVFGATRSLDAFLIAFRLPNLLRELLAEGALGSSFTKVFSELWEEDRPRAIKLLHDALWCFALLGGVLILVGIIAAPLLVDGLTIFSSNHDTSTFYQQSVALTRLMFPFIGFMMLGSIVSGVLHQRDKFFFSAVSPILLNVGFLIGALVFSWLSDRYAPPWVEEVFIDKRITGLALGALLGGALQLLTQLGGIWRGFIGPHLRLPREVPWSKDIAKVLALMSPMVIAGSAGQVNVLVNTNFATSLQEGAVTWLTFAFRVLQLPIGLFAVAIGTVSLPSLTRAALRRQSSGKSDELADELLRSMEWMFWLMLPCLVFFLANSSAIVTLLYQHGAFDEQASRATAAALYFYSFGLPGYGLIKVLTSYYYAIGQTRYPMVVGIVSIVVNFVVNLLLVTNFGHTGLAMTTSLVLLSNAAFLLMGLRHIDLMGRVTTIKGPIGLLVLASVVSWVGQQIIGGWLPLDLVEPSVKLSALSMLAVNGVVVSLGFGAIGWIRYRGSNQLVP